jgi:O-antigen ligase
MVAWFFNHQVRLMRVGIVIGVLLFAVLLGLVAGGLNPLFALIASIAPFLLVGIEILIRRFHWFPLVILLSALFVPFSLPTGSGSNLVASLLVTVVLTALWIIRVIAVDKAMKPVKHPINMPIYGFIIVTIISLVWSNIFRDIFVNVWESFPFVQTASMLVMVMLPIALLITLNCIKDLKNVQILVYVMIAAGYLGLVKFYVMDALPVNIGGMFNMWVMCLAYALVLFDKNLQPVVRVGLLALVAVYIFYAFFQHIDWLAGWLPGVVALAFVTVMRSKKLAALFTVIAIIVFAAMYNSYFKEVIAEEMEISGVTRVDAWLANWNITKEHLLFGTGPAGYAAYYMTYFPEEAMATHSNYIDILSQTGILGMLFLLSIFGVLLVRGYKLSVQIKGSGDFTEAVINASFAGTIACLVIMAFGDWLFPFAYTQTIEGYSYAVYNWIFMGLIPFFDRAYTASALRENR